MLAKVNEHAARFVQKFEHAYRSSRSHEIQVRHATTEQRMSFTQVVMDSETRHFRSQFFSGFIAAQKLGDVFTKRFGAIVNSTKRRLRHRILQHARSNWMTLSVISI